MSNEISDRELIELAAKATGLQCEWLEGWRGPVIGHGMASKSWLPLEDDGDALRLAVKLGTLHKAFVLGIAAEMGVAAGNSLEGGEEIQEPFGGDANAATRRAIVRAAAEIGRTQEAAHG